MNLAIRGFLKGVRVWERTLTLKEQQLQAVLPALARDHAEAMAAGKLSMIEIEFLDEPNINERFFRLGTDPFGMVIPIEVKL
jgi:hypothetical protein